MNKLTLARCSAGKDLLHGAEKKALLLGQLNIGPNSLWVPFVTIKLQLMYCLVLCCVVALPHQDLHANITTALIHNLIVYCRLSYLHSIYLPNIDGCPLGGGHLLIHTLLSMKNPAALEF